MRRRAALLLAAVVVLAGCGSSDAASRASAHPTQLVRPCAAIPLPTLERVFGETFRRPAPAEKFDTGLRRCTFVGTHVTVSLAIYRDEAPNLDAELGWHQPGDPLVLTRTAPRIGQDSAFLTEPGPVDDRAASLLVVTHGRGWNFDADGAPQVVLQRQLLALARAVVTGATGTTRRGA